MFPPRHFQSRYLAAARRAQLTRLAAIGVMVVVPAACSNGDAATFAQESDTTTVLTTPSASTTGGDGTADSTTATTEVTTTEVPTTTADDAPTTDAPTTDATATTDSSVTTTDGTSETTTVPATTEMVVDFTYSPSATGQIRNPYVAVWIEDTDGNLVRTISVWFEQSQKGTRWLSDLSQWASVTDQVSSTVTGATRAPGSYSLVWDGTDDDGNLVAEGDYVLAIETAREHGPHSVTTATITLSGAATTVQLPDETEIVGASATVSV